MDENLLSRLEELLQDMGAKQDVSDRDKALLEEVRSLKKDLNAMSQSHADSNVKLEILTERFAGFLTRYEELKEDVEALQAKHVDEAGDSKKFKEQALLLAVGGVVTYIVQALLNK